jgi:hypothetical protein
MSSKEGLQLTTANIRVRANGKGRQNGLEGKNSLEKRLTKQFKTSAVNAKKRRDKSKSRTETAKRIAAAVAVLEGIAPFASEESEAGITNAVEEFTRTCARFSKTVEALLSNSRMEEEKEGEEEKKEKDDDANVNDEKRIRTPSRYGERRSSSSESASLRNEIEHLKKRQLEIKKKLEAVPKVCKAVRGLTKATNDVIAKVASDAKKTLEFKRTLCLDLKGNYDPLYGGSIGYEDGKRTDPYGDNLSTTVWDSRTSKPS